MLFFLLLVAATPSFADDQTPMVPSAPPPTVQGPVDCANLNQKEQIFASQMTDWNNRSIFCAKLTAEQRKAVMELAARPDAQGILMTPDQALKAFIQQNPSQSQEIAPQQGLPARRPSGCSGG